MIRKHDKPFQQVIKRCNEKNHVGGEISKNNNTKFPNLKCKHNNGPLLENINGLQYEKLYLKGITVKTNRNADSFFFNQYQ